MAKKFNNIPYLAKCKCCGKLPSIEVKKTTPIFQKDRAIRYLEVCCPTFTKDIIVWGINTTRKGSILIAEKSDNSQRDSEILDVWNMANM